MGLLCQLLIYFVVVSIVVASAIPVVRLVLLPFLYMYCVCVCVLVLAL